jgi:hypothetical protein
LFGKHAISPSTSTLTLLPAQVTQARTYHSHEAGADCLASSLARIITSDAANIVTFPRPSSHTQRDARTSSDHNPPLKTLPVARLPARASAAWISLGTTYAVWRPRVVWTRTSCATSPATRALATSPRSWDSLDQARPHWCASCQCVKGLLVRWRRLGTWKLALLSEICLAGLWCARGAAVAPIPPHLHTQQHVPAGASCRKGIIFAHRTL